MEHYLTWVDFYWSEVTSKLSGKVNLRGTCLWRIGIEVLAIYSLSLLSCIYSFCLVWLCVVFNLLEKEFRFTELWLAFTWPVCMCECMSGWGKTTHASLKVSLANLTACSESFQSESWFSIKHSKNFLRHLFIWKDWISAGGAQKAVFITEDLCLECQKMKNILAPKKPS